MQRDTLIAVAAVVVTGGALSSLFLFNRTPADDVSSSRPPLRIDSGRALMARDLDDADQAARMIHERIRASDELNDLSAEQVRQLADRCADVIVVRCQGSSDDFIALLESWGGRLNIPEDGPDHERMKKSWLSPGHEHAVAEVGLHEVGAARIEPTPGEARVSRRTGVSKAGMMTNAPVDFAGDRVELLKSGADQVEVHFPVRSNAGDVREVGIRMIWSAPDGGWVPLVFIQYVESGRPMPSSIF